jgi:hypothetical protein
MSVSNVHVFFSCFFHGTICRSDGPTCFGQRDLAKAAVSPHSQWQANLLYLLPYSALVFRVLRVLTTFFPQIKEADVENLFKRKRKTKQ